MVGPRPVRVECSTCGSHHNFRPRAPGDKGEPTVRSRASGISSPRPARVSGAARAEQAKVSREQTWEKAIAGRGVSDFRRYNVAQTFQEGDLIRHAKFGDGVVTRVLDPRKVEVLFRDEPRTLAQGMIE
ncbi:hypothetical protein LZC95_17630 [Pendulispora brunnea]|uniref:Uncharacterized protein n=1 Tax=Pendulispora brunnea TaxID=2905690 RepID=A0ABZ2KIZ6_9BACT